MAAAARGQPGKGSALFSADPIPDDESATWSRPARSASRGRDKYCAQRVQEAGISLIGKLDR